MVKLNKIYTRTGDAGTTGLVDGSRLPKHAPRMQAVGDVDEANSAIGLAIIAMGDRPEATWLTTIQNDLFDLGADLCVPESDTPPDFEPLRVTAGQVERLEAAIDRLNARLEPLNSFILPAGSEAAARLHFSRTVCRRAERRISALIASGARINPQALKYANRLSDLLFVMARIANLETGGDVLWVPGKDR